MKQWMKTNKTWPLYLAFVVELLFLFYYKGEFGFVVSPLLLIGSGLFMAVYPYFISRNSEQGSEAFFIEFISPSLNASKQTQQIVWAVFALVAVAIGLGVSVLIKKHPIDINHSDIIPFIQNVYVDRVRSGVAIYAEVEGYGYGKFHPGYLPFHWMFFVISSLLNVDHRWVPFTVFIMATAIYTLVILRNFNELKKLILLLLLPLFVLFTIYYENSSDAMHSIEILVLGYYLILCVSLFSRNVLAQAGGLLLPILSRYALVFWLPVHFLGMVPKQYPRFFKVGFTLLGLVALFIVPFFINSPSMFEGFNGAYKSAAIGEWGGQPWQAPGDEPFQLFRGLGLASWFYKFYPGSLEEKIMALQKTMIYVSIATTLFLLLIRLRVSKVLKPNLFSLLALKFSLTLFYAFMIIPYNYLMWVPMVVSVVILSRIKENLFVQSN
ncbi:MAG: hypothetical protein SGJ00_05730 [bacterium]|nr:hypothetical protein [bacterium]